MSPDTVASALARIDLAEPPAGRLAGRRLDVDALEVVAVARISLHLGLGRRTGQRKRGLDVVLVCELDEIADRPEEGEIFRTEVEHGHAMAVYPGLDVDHHIRALLGQRYCGEPLHRLHLVEFDTEPACRGNDAVDVCR